MTFWHGFRSEEDFKECFYDTSAEVINDYRFRGVIESKKVNKSKRVIKEDANEVCRKVDDFMYNYRERAYSRGYEDEIEWGYQPATDTYSINLNNYGASKVRVSYRNGRKVEGEVDSWTRHIVSQILFYGAKNFDVCY